MLDSIRLLSNVYGQNGFSVVPIVYLRDESFPQDFYIQLWQSDLGIAYTPAPTATLQIQFLRSDTLGEVPESQSQLLDAETPFADRSIWKVTLGETQIKKIISGGFRVVISDSLPAAVVNIAGAGTPGVERATNVVTVITQTPHGLAQGDSVLVAGVSDATFDGTFTVASVVSDTKFTYQQADVDATSGGGTMENAVPQPVQETVFSSMSIRKIPASQDPLNTDT